MSDQGSGDMSRTLLGGSEEDYAVVCDPCKFAKQHVEAKAYCFHCNENLCTACIKVHGKMAGLRDHTIETDVRSQSRKGKAGKPTQPTYNDPLTDTCEQHQQEIVKFYCNTHKTLGCSACLPLSHKKCKAVSYIRDVSGNVANSDELKNVRSELRHVAARLIFSKSNMDNAKERIAHRYAQALEEIDTFQEEIINYVFEISDDARQEATRLRDEALKESDEQAAACKELVNETEQMTTDMDSRSKSGLNNGLYIAMKRTKAKLPGLQKKTKQFSDMTPSRFVFKREDKLQGILSSRVRLGKLNVTNAPRVAKYVENLNVSSDTDTQKCLITGIAVISGDRLATIDNKNNALKMMDVKKRKITDEVSTTSTPIGITPSEEDMVAVTLKGERIIQIFSPTPTLSKRRAIQVLHLYSGIAYTSDRFALTPQSTETDKSIHVCDTSGTLIRKIEIGMQDPWQITLSPAGEDMYVGDVERDAVFCFNMNGTIVDTYSHKDLKSPAGIAVDEEGHVYVCSKEGHCVHRVIPGAGTGEPILTKKQGVDFPVAITYNRDRLYISSSSLDPNIGNFIKIFKLN